MTLTDSELTRLDQLEGLIPAEVGEALAGYAAQVPADLAIVEVGSYKGKSGCYLAAGAKSGHGAHVWCVDAWDTDGNVTGRFGFAEPSTFDAFQAQVRKMQYTKRITPLKGFSVEVAAHWTGPQIGLLYIDADHQARSVLADFRSWEPYLAPGAVVVFDDVDTKRNPGVRLIVDKLARTRGPSTVEAGRLAVFR